MLRKNITNSTKLTVDPFQTTVRRYFGQHASRVEGTSLGIEIEIESNNERYPSNATVSPFWRGERDGSLRNPQGGEGGKEYVSIPLRPEQVEEALEVLETRLRKTGTDVVRSPRTSVHVHMNAQDLTLSQLVQWMLVYYAVEPLLCAYHGQEREHNLFCLQMRQTPTLADNIYNFLTTQRIENSLKYAALNIMPLRERGYGTLEFRAGAGILRTPMEVKPWVDMLLEVMNYAVILDGPEHVVGLFSRYSPLEFVEACLPFVYEQCISRVDDRVEMEDNLLQSLRCAQQLAYDIDWGAFEETAPTKKKKTRHVVDDGRGAIDRYMQQRAETRRMEAARLAEAAARFEPRDDFNWADQMARAATIGRAAPVNHTAMINTWEQALIDMENRYNDDNN